MDAIDRPASYQIVTGVDGSEGGRRALRWAAQQAAERAGEVTAIIAWRWDLPGGGLPTTSATAEEEPSRAAAELIAQEVNRVQPVVTVRTQVQEGRPGEVLSAAARGADLLVLGSHGHSRVWHTVLGSVAEECIRRSVCPVVVIPMRHPDGPELPEAPTAAARR
ncbi:universal stress protein [Natronosporangium hydrolyticum]|uniref:Universal stress protein n=1 Tax=Natronosporangium hydrolyticum TaxID=2811111 RepID=A0A895YAC1_9ACTN|nr:universal stress protein [Natronosporangium hydrolyticum]QSB13202.1 universal stress protein [Natronosporangium hydrolyticum]